MSKQHGFESLLLSNSSSIKIRNPQAVLTKIQKIKSDAFSKLMFISDFDATMSKHHTASAPEIRLPSTFGVIEQSTGLPPSAQKICEDNYKNYYPKEMDLTISADEKLKLMIEWWTSSQNAMVAANVITEKIIIDAVKKSDVCLRDDTDKLLKFCNQSEIPFLVFSAGCGDIISNMLKHKEPICWTEKNMVLISNMLGFDEETGILKEFKAPLIHTLNKKNFVKHVKEFQAENSAHVDGLVKGRNNIILMGDHLGDVNMKCGMEDINECLNIGFINYKIKENLETYMDTFDVVLVNDETMDFPNQLMEYLKQ